jgi:hypothetical protein
MTEQPVVDGPSGGDEPPGAHAMAASDANAASPTGTDVKAPTPYPFSVWRVLATAVRIIKRNFVPFLVLACVFESPVVLWKLGGGTGMYRVMIMQQLCNLLITSVVAYGVIMELHGTRPSTRSCITTGFAQLGRVVGVTIVSTLAIVGGTVLLVVPGIVIALMLYVVVPVAVYERVGIRTSLKRSRELTDDRKGDLFLIMVLGTGIGFAIEQFAPDQIGREAALLWRALGTAFSSMFFAVTAAVAYVELRKLKDGTQIPEIATAFARIRK